MRMALYQPDIPGNTGAIMRTAACLGLPVDLIGPCGFVVSKKQMRRAGMDYLDRLDWTEHASWESFLAARNGAARLVLLSTKADIRYSEFTFLADDILLVGRESAGVPAEVLGAPMPRSGCRWRPACGR